MVTGFSQPRAGGISGVNRQSTVTPSLPLEMDAFICVEPAPHNFFTFEGDYL